MSGDVLTQRRKSTEIGVVTQARLGDVCRIDTSISFPCEEEIWLLNLDMIEQQTGRVIQRIYVDRNALGGSTVAFDEHCVLYSKLRPNLNKVVLPDRKGVATSEILPLRCDADHATREFVCWFLRSPTFVSYAMNRTAGAKMPRLGTKELLNVKIPLPPLADQRRIATKLDRLCDIVTKRKQQLVQLQQLVKSRFEEMFGDIESGSQKFPVRNLEDVCLSMSAGKDVPDDCVKIKDEEHTVPIYSNGIESNGLYGYTRDARITAPSVTISGRGTIGFVCRREVPFVPIIRLVVATPDLQIVDLVYLESALRGRCAKNTGTAIPQLPVPVAKRIPVMLPPLALQREFAAFVEKVDKLAFAVKNSLESAEKLYCQQLSEAFA